MFGNSENQTKGVQQEKGEWMNTVQTLEEIKNRYTWNTAADAALFEAMRAVRIIENIRKIVDSNSDEFIAEYVKGMVSED